MTSDEQRGYSKGYAAGKRRAAREANRVTVRGLREQFIQRMMIAVAPQVIARPWGKTVKGEWIPNQGADEIMGTARLIGEAAAGYCDFWLPAQAIEARRAETETGSVHESAVAEGDAP